MITLYRFGRFLGAPDSSPFVMKVMVLLRLAGLAYREAQGLPFKAPKGLIPYIEDDGVTVADSTFIRFHIERKYGVDFDAALDARQKAVAWAAEKLCEDHLYWAMLELRWLDDANFKNGLGRFMFGPIPMPLRPLVKAILRRTTRRRLMGHGMGRMSRGEIAELARRDLDALALLLGDKPYLMGDEPSAADAALFGIIAALLTPELSSPVIAAAQSHANLVAFRDRMMRRYFPELIESTARSLAP